MHDSPSTENDHAVKTIRFNNTRQVRLSGGVIRETGAVLARYGLLNWVLQALSGLRLHSACALLCAMHPDLLK